MYTTDQKKYDTYHKQARRCKKRYINSLPLIKSPILKGGLIREVTSLEGAQFSDILLYLIILYQKCGLWWEWPDKIGCLWWEWPDKIGCLWWEWPDKIGCLWWEWPYNRGITV
jgi:hypothetical protein